MSDLRAFFQTVVDAYHGIALSNGATLNSSHKSNIGAPRLKWKPQGISAEYWQSTSYRVVADIPAELSLVVAAEDEDEILDAIDDVGTWTDKICGLPIIEDAREDSGFRVVPFGDKLWDTPAGRAKIKYFGDRFIGPVLNKVAIRDGHGKDGLAYADLTFHMEFVVDTSVDSDHVVRVVSLGLIPLTVAKDELDYRPVVDFEFILPDREREADTIRQGGYQGPELDINIDKTQVDVGNPPVPDGIQLEPGADPATQLQFVQPIPASATVSTTKQLQGIAVFADGGTQNITAIASWMSDTPGVATVSSTGLVTAVAPGSATITATYLGISGTSRITVP